MALVPHSLYPVPVDLPFLQCWWPVPMVLHDHGHALNLPPDAPKYQAAVVSWADAVVGR